MTSMLSIRRIYQMSFLAQVSLNDHHICYSLPAEAVLGSSNCYFCLSLLELSVELFSCCNFYHILMDILTEMADVSYV